ncbi:MAG: CoA transferase [Gammaproteobacteria bacterium]|jgi:crotonobetainyl-CoA:carnitine CoA-transferase CaiB-like acyl-CoA transferase
MPAPALAGIRVADVAGTVSTSYCAKLFADYGAEVLNFEPREGFATRRLPPFLNGGAPGESSAMHAFLHANKKSLVADDLEPDTAHELLASASLVLDDGEDRPLAEAFTGVRSSISWYGKGGPYEHFAGSDGQCFALNAMVRNIGHEEGPPLIPTGYQAQIVGGMTCFIGSMAQVIAGEIGNRTEPVHLETSIFESCLCFTEVGAVGWHNSGRQAPRLGINRFPPTYPLGVFPCRDGWLGVTVLTPSQWRSFCELLDMRELADVELFQTSIGRLQGLDVIEPLMRERLLEHSAEALFYRAQEARIPLARVPTMEELFEVDQFLERKAFTTVTLPHGDALRVPSVPFRLFDTPPALGGTVASLGQHTEAFSS